MTPSIPMAVEPATIPTAAGQNISAMGVIIRKPTPVVIPAVAPRTKGCSSLGSIHVDCQTCSWAGTSIPGR
ncbi:MAG: hypothetical protein A2Z31_07345 [candidate division NC10 bacterium RBG_16_65_8]|nr:MAG: hypothetical protein A2Z31_07345 [candidate division NC10 bacterium RBG_16_65_8]